MTSAAYHIPVMAEASLGWWCSEPAGTYVDATFGGGGHSRLLLEALSPAAKLIGFDQDPEARANAPQDPRLRFIPANFREMEAWLLLTETLPVDGILADLGVSSHQLDETARGFTFREEAPLDMRMNPDQPLDAATVVNEYSEEQLEEILKAYGELRNARALARAIVGARGVAALQTSSDLNRALQPVLPKYNDWKILARVYQAVRIEVNDELNALKQFLQQSLRCLRPGGRLVVLSYHSLEDRLVKTFLREGRFGGKAPEDFYGRKQTPWRELTRGAEKATEEEMEQNPRARSVRLRAAEKQAQPLTS